MWTNFIEVELEKHFLKDQDGDTNMNTHFKESTTSLAGTAVERTMENTQGKRPKKLEHKKRVAELERI